MSGSQKKEVNDGKGFKILAIDGGGIRGVCPAAFLGYVEERIEQPIYRYFDLIVGTSTGGIIALALSLGISASEILALYRERGQTIFERRHPQLPKCLARVAGSLYRNGPLQNELKNVFGEETTLGKALRPVCIPAVNITSGNNVVFKSRHHKDYDRDHRLPMWRVAAATSAAPIYYSPVEIPEFGWFVDGGLWTNSPTMVGVLEGLKLEHEIKEIHVLSIGTGTASFYKKGAPENRRFGHARFGLKGWGKQLVSLVMRAQTQRARNFTRYLLPDDQHLRVDFELPPGECDLDDVDKTEILVNRGLAQAKNLDRKVRKEFFDVEAPEFAPIP